MLPVFCKFIAAASKLMQGCHNVLHTLYGFLLRAMEICASTYYSFCGHKMGIRPFLPYLIALSLLFREAEQLTNFSGLRYSRVFVC